MTGTHLSPAPTSTAGAATDDSAGTSLETRLADRTRELDELIRQHGATVEILDIIARSPAGLQPMLDAVVRAAVRHCGADDATMFLREGTEMFGAAHEGPLPSGFGTRRPTGGSPLDALIIRDGQTIHAPDTEALDPVEFASVIAIARQRGVRALVGAPIKHAGEVIGYLLLRRREVGPFSARQIAMLETFATQAGVAVANAGVITELRESLEQQTATAEVLQVINASPGDTTPVFEAILQKAHALCGIAYGSLQLYDGQKFHAVATHSLPEPLAMRLREGYVAGPNIRQLIDGAGFSQFPDIGLVDDPMAKAAAEGGIKTLLCVPLRTAGRLLGQIVCVRKEVRPFANREIALLQGFATQAVIAMENARLITETREALEQQTATAEILSVISQSPTDVGPVLSAVARAAMKFCGANDALVGLRDDNEWVIAAHEGPIKTIIGTRRILTRLTAPGRAMTDAKVVQIMDLQSQEGHEFPEGREIGAKAGFRSTLAAPLVRDDISIGAISLRRREAGEFEPRQVELLKTFAAQAVIAIENVRLFTELRESLEQQTATAEILRVISQSPTDVQPVLDAVVKATLRFCGATDAVVILREGSGAVFAAHAGPLILTPGSSLPLNRESAPGRAILDGRTCHFPDIQSLDPVEFATAHRLAAAQGFRAAVSAPLLRKNFAIGSVALRKPEVGPFTAQQIELLETFAAQAVIAIENVRLFTELRESLERLKAAQANLIQSEKMASLGQLTAGIAHEIKNPLNFVNNFAGLTVELLAEIKEVAAPAFAHLDEDKRAEIDETMALITGNLAKIAEHGKRADGIVKSMLSHSRGGTGDWQAADINALVEEALNLAYHGARAQDKNFNITLDRDLAPTSEPVEVVPQDVTRVFLNLFGNGFYAANKRLLAGTEAGFKPLLRVSTRDLGEMVEIKVRDNGTGIPDEVRAKLFQPFFTTKPTGEGTGLGLSISYDIVTQQHGGTIEVESEAGSFTEFTVRLPRSRRVAPAERTG